MEFDEFRELHTLVFANPRFEAWKVLQQKILDAQLKIDHQLIKEDDSNEFFKLRVYQRFIDAIFWVHVNYQLTDIRRIYYSGAKMTSLHYGNFASHMRAVDKANNESEHFALHSDLATNIAIGDVIYLMANDTFFVPSELKEGSVNEEILEAIKRRENGDSKLYSEIVSNDKKAKQLKRVERQIGRMQDEMQLYLKNKTILPPDTSMPVGGIKKILYRSMEPESYEDELGALLNGSCPNGWKSIEVDGCLEVVLIRSQEGAQSFFNQIKEDRKIVIDLLNYNFTETFSRPLVSFKFSASDLWDLFTGKISIFLTFSIDKYLDIFAGETINYQKITGKKFRKLMQSPVGKRPFDFYGEFAVSLSSDGESEFYWTEAMAYRMFGCLQKPSAIYRLHCEMLGEMENATSL